MANLLDQLNANSGALSAVFSGVVTVATVIYAWLTAKLVYETRQMRQVQTEPRIQVTYRVRDEWINLLDISVRNIGLGPAYDIKFAVRAETESAGSQDLVSALLKLASFSKGLIYLGPNQEFFSFWTSLADGDASKVESRFVIACTYRSATGTSYEHDCTVDLSELKGSSRIGEPPLLTMAKHLESMKKDLHALASGRGRIKVDTFSSEDRSIERAELQERARQSPVGGK